MEIKVEQIKPVTNEEIAKVEKLTGLTFPDSFKNFILKNNGGIPSINGRKCCVDIKLSDTSSIFNCIECFTSMEEAAKQWEFIDYLEDLAEHFELDENYVEADKLFPVADFPNGAVYIALGGKHLGKIYTADNGDFGIKLNSNSLDEFLSKLYPYSPNESM